MLDRREDPQPEISVVVPVLNESENIRPLLQRLIPILEQAARSFEIIIVDDGSSDDTLDILRALNRTDRRIAAISFSRNFGKEIAIAAGLDHAAGQAAIMMDADLQHPPETVAEFIAKWRDGYKNVFAQRRDRYADSPLRRALTQRFYRLFDLFGETNLPPGAGDFRLLDRQAIEAIARMRERARFSKGLYAWIGFKSIGVPYDVAERAAGSSKFSYRKLTRFALDGLMSFSTIPLRVWTYIGFAISLLSLSLTAFFLIRTLIYGVDVPGFASLIVSVTFLSGIQLLSLGVLGEYVGRIFAEVKRRPLYLIAERIGGEREVMTGAERSETQV
jgi:glycosyltransferase involved in cell wall biosynthesis